MRIRKMIFFMLLFSMLLSAAPGAFADGYRLKEEIREYDSTVYTYNSDGNLVRASYMEGGQEYGYAEYSYAKDGSLAEKSEWMGYGKLIFHYDRKGTKIELDNPGVGGDVFLEGGEQGRIERNANGNITKMTVRSIFAGEKDKVYTYLYDEEGRIKTFEISDFRRDTFDYSSSGYTRTSTSLYDGTTTVRERYNARGQLTESTDQYGNVYTYIYNAEGDLIKQLMPGEEHFDYLYEKDANGNVIKMTAVFSGEGEPLITEYRYEKAE